MTSKLVGSYYRADRGGHAPGDVRDAFIKAVDAYDGWWKGQPEPTVELRDQQVPISEVSGLLWNCTDILPRSVFDRVFDLDEAPHNRTYGAAARWLRRRPPWRLP